MGADPFEWVGHTLDGRYQALSVAGEGGFGVVYRGHHLSLDVPVAIKCLKVPQSLGRDERAAFEKRFAEEGRVLHRLSRASANVVQALDVGSTESPNGSWTPYLVLEWLEGHGLDTEIQQRRRRGEARWSVAEAVVLLSPAAQALGEAHAQRVAHRDVKPANLFLTRVGERQVLKVLDFGIAKVVQDSLTRTEALAMTGQAPPAFTPRYGAPEQFDRRRGATGPWTDVHALALVLVELLIGEHALEGDDTVQLMTCALDRERRPTPKSRGLDVGDALEAVIARGLALQPEERFDSASAFWRRVLAACPEASKSVSGTAHDTSGDPASAPNEDPHQSTVDYLAVHAARIVSDRGREGAPEPEPEPGDAGLETADWIARRATPAKRRARPDDDGESGPAAGSDRDSAAAPLEPAPTSSPDGSRISARSVDPRTVGATTASRAPTPPAGRQLLLVLAALAVTAVAGWYVLREPPAPSQRSARPDRTAEAPPAATEEVAVAASAASATDSPDSSAAPSSVSSLAKVPAQARSSAAATTSAGPAATAGAATSMPASSAAIAPADYCDGSCATEGRCTAMLESKAVVCRATSDADCKKTYSCTVHGACWARGGHCVALSAADCNKSQGCKQSGECSFRKGKCLQELITDCSKYPVCKQLGMCTARDNACFATRDADCQASDTCAQAGNCRSNGSSCVP